MNNKVIRAKDGERPTERGFYWWRMINPNGPGWTKGKVVWIGEYAGISGLGQVYCGQIMPVGVMTVSEWQGPLSEPNWHDMDEKS